MRFRYIFLLPLLFAFCQCTPGKYTSTSQCEGDSIRIAFYNVENLFDLQNNPDREDDQFLPDGDKKWTQERYDKKLKDLSRVISTIGYGESPPLMGLCEVENEVVLNDLLKQPAFSKGDFRYLHKDSPDRRGIDVCLLYDRR